MFGPMAHTFKIFSSSSSIEYIGCCSNALSLNTGLMFSSLLCPLNLIRALLWSEISLAICEGLSFLTIFLWHSPRIQKTKKMIRVTAMELFRILKKNGFSHLLWKNGPLHDVAPSVCLVWCSLLWFVL